MSERDDDPRDFLALLVRLWMRNQTAAERIFLQLDVQPWELDLFADDLRRELDNLKGGE